MLTLGLNTSLPIVLDPPGEMSRWTDEGSAQRWRSRENVEKHRMLAWTGWNVGCMHVDEVSFSLTADGPMMVSTSCGLM